MEPSLGSDAEAFTAVEKVLTGCVSKVLRKFRGEACTTARPRERGTELDSADSDDFLSTPPYKKKKKSRLVHVVHMLAICCMGCK